MRLLSILGVVLLLSACQPGEAVGEQSESFFTLKPLSVTNSFSVPAEADSAEAVAIRRERFIDGLVPAMQAVSNAVSQSSSWREQDAALRRFLAEKYPDPTVQSRREIIVASSYPPGHLLNDDELTPEKQEAIAFYATLLIENRQLGGDKVTKALDRLEGFWPEAKLAEARQLVAQAQQPRVPSA